MGSIEDSRKAVQDFLAPDLKALTARLEALEKEMHAGFADAEKMNLERLESVKTQMALGFVQVEKGFAHAEKMNLERFASASARHDSLLALMAANHSSIMNTLEFDKRLSRLESERKAEPPHA